MKKFKLTYLVALLAAVVFSSCANLSQMVDRASEVKHDVTPSPLEMHGEKVKVSMTTKFPPKYFLKNAELIATPILKYDGKEKELKSIAVQGEGVNGNNKSIPFESGGSVTFSDEFEYSDEMRVATLELKIKAKMKDQEVEVPGTIKVADGIITTPRLVNEGLEVDNGDGNSWATAGSQFAKPAFATPALIQNNLKLYKANINYLIQSSTIRSTELRGEDIKKQEEQIKAAVEAELKFVGVEISSYASPDGPERMNENLSGDRTKAAERHIQKILKKYKVKDYKDASLYTKRSTAETWGGAFKVELQNSGVANKNAFLTVINMPGIDEETREERIEVLAGYEDIKADVLPKLRRSDITVKFETPKKTEEQIHQLAKNNPEELTAVELLYGASLEKSLDERLKIYKSFKRLFPKDWRGANNVGVVYVYQNKMSEAKTEFEAAKSLAPNNGTVLNNLGVIELANDNLEAAETNFADAKAAGAGIKEIDYNLGVINIKKGKYSDAVNFFNSFGKPTFNGALAKLLADDANAALKSVKNVKTSTDKNEAKLSYLKAVINARLENTVEIIKNLRNATKKDSSWKAYAKKDLEFFRLLEDVTFKALIN